MIEIKDNGGKFFIQDGPEKKAHFEYTCNNCGHRDEGERMPDVCVKCGSKENEVNE